MPNSTPFDLESIQCYPAGSPAHKAVPAACDSARFALSFHRSPLLDVRAHRCCWGDDAVNILHEPALAARAQYQALRPTFSDWLLAQRKRTRADERRDNVGLMTLRLLSTQGLPAMPKSLPLLRDHYQRRGAQHVELEGLEAASVEFIPGRLAS